MRTSARARLPNQPEVYHITRVCLGLVACKESHLFDATDIELELVTNEMQPDIQVCVGSARASLPSERLNQTFPRALLSERRIVVGCYNKQHFNRAIEPCGGMTARYI